MTTPTLTRAAFTAWLAQWPDEAIVGTAQSPCGCPIARFLESLPTVDEAFVNDRYYLILKNNGEWSHNETRFSMPAWARAFIERVDDWLDDDIVTAGTAREYLARIPDESEATAK